MAVLGKVLFACWITEGQWEVRIDGPHLPNGQRHVHVRRKRGRKGEYSWNKDGTRHDKHKFPVTEGMISSAKHIAASRLGVPPGILELMTIAPSFSRVLIIHEDGTLAMNVLSVADDDVVVLVSESWLIFVSVGQIQGNPAQANADA